MYTACIQNFKWTVMAWWVLMVGTWFGRGVVHIKSDRMTLKFSFGQWATYVRLVTVGLTQLPGTSQRLFVPSPNKNTSAVTTGCFAFGTFLLTSFPYSAPGKHSALFGDFTHALIYYWFTHNLLAWCFQSTNWNSDNLAGISWRGPRKGSLFNLTFQAPVFSFLHRFG